jgi:hypothetical protein
VSAADGWGRAGSGRGEGSAGDVPLGPRGGEEARASGRERGGVWAGNGPTEGGFLFSFSIFSFLFLFLISISFISFSFEQIIS